MSKSKGPEFNNDIYIATRYSYDEANVEARYPLGKAIAHFIAQIGFPIEFPDNPCDDRRYGISAHIIAEIGKNLFYWLTTDELSSEDGFRQTRVSILSDGIAAPFSGSRGFKNKADTGAVRVLVESSPGKRAMDVAMRLWSLFFSNLTFTMGRKIFSSSTGEVIGSRQDLVVQRVFPLSEPEVSKISSDDEFTVEFRLGVRFTRS